MKRQDRIDRLTEALEAAGPAGQPTDWRAVAAAIVATSDEGASDETIGGDPAAAPPPEQQEGTSPDEPDATATAPASDSGSGT